MKSMVWKLCLAGAFVWFAAGLGTGVARAAEDERPGPGDRLQRLERRLDELSARQEQMMRRLAAPEERRGRLAPQGPLPGQHPMPSGQPSPENLRRRLAAAGMPAPAPVPAPRAARVQKGLHDLVGLVILCAIICNILLAVWIFTDIRKRGEGSGIFIALALVAGIPTAIIYALVRIGDKKA